MLDNVALEDPNASLQKIATAINVQLKLSDGTEIPFIPFNEFDNSVREDKVYLYGPSGSGKSRSIFEIIRSKVTTIDRIYVINPRTVIAGTESGRIDLYELIDRFTENDTVLWDNFPDDLVKKDIESGRKALEVISSKNVKNLLVALKPKYLESYRDIVTDIFELYEHSVKYDKEKIKSIVKTYGTNIRFRDLFGRYIAKDLDKISKILWEKEPTPLIVLDYYKELSNKESQRQDNQLKEEEQSKELNGIVEAENLLVSTEYYEHQFRYISSIKDRSSDAEFLYALRLCYDIAQARTVKSVEELQKGIFNSVSPIEASRKLTTWVYLSGQNYAMHDVARHSIKFHEHVRIQIMQYLTTNFLKIVGANIDNRETDKQHTQQQEQQKPSEQFLHALCVFLGKNLNFMPRGSPHSFLPENIYSYIKKNAQLENAFGQGVGENFESLDEELQEIIMNRIETEVEFASGMGESLGRLYPRLDDYDKRQQLMKKMYSGGLFARHFGQSLGRIFKYIPEEIKKEVLIHTEQNTQIADGLGMGIGYVFKSLDDEFQKEVFLRAQKNSSLSRGLGLGFGLRFLSMDSMEVSELFTKADKDTEFDKGLGLGLAALFIKYRHLLPADFFENPIQRWGSEHSEFMFGFGFNSIFVGLDKVPNEVLALMEKDGELAYGASMGFGMYFLYMPPQIQQSLLAQASHNIKLDLGLGTGMGVVFKHLSDEIQHGELILGRGDKKSEYDAGVGFGIGFMWSYQKEDVVQKVYARIATNSGFAFGLGDGLGFNFEYLSEPMVEEIFRRADKNVELDRGLGLGIGWIFRYLDGELVDKVLGRAVTNSGFAFGLGRGLGRTYRYLPEEMKKDLLSFDDYATPSSLSAEASFPNFAFLAKNNSEFIKGFASGLGSYALMMYIGEEGFVKKVFQRAKEDGEFSSGLAEGLGYSFRYLPAEFQKEIMSEATSLKNSEFTKGIGIGLGRTFEYLPSDLKDRSLFDLVQKNVQFAIGYGIGLGRIFKYLSVQNRKDIFARAAADSGLAKGLGIGLGSIFPYLPDDLQSEIFVTHAENNVQFAKGLGIGLGSIFPYLADRNSILKLAESNIQLHMGIGEGLGRIFKYLDPTVTRELFTRIKSNKKDSGFAKGAGAGLGAMFQHFDQQFFKEVCAGVQDDNNSKDFFVGLGTGVGSIFPYLSETLAEEAFKQIRNDSGYARALGFAIGHVYPSTSNEQRSIIMQQADDNNNTEFAYGLGEGLGHNLPSLRSELQEEILKLNLQKNSEFRKGLGLGLGYSFNYVDEIVQDELLVLTDEGESEFATSLAHGVALIFPSLSDKLQQKILKHSQTRNKFADGFGLGLGYSIKYLDKNMQEQISNLTCTNPYLQKSLNASHYSNTTTTTATTSVADNEMILRYDDFPLPSSVTFRSSTELQPWNIGADTEQEVSFSGLRQYYCICYIDMMDSTKIASQIKENEMFKYYSLFLNATATIARNFGAKIIKNAGDCLIYYFPKTSDASNNPTTLKDVLECGITLTVAHRAINAKLHAEKLPPINYRISADYGIVEVAKSRSSQSDDLFGTAMNLCAKINSKAPANGMVIGESLYELVKSFEDYNFGKMGDQPGAKYQYPAYLVESKHKRTILNPFKRVSE